LRAKIVVVACAIGTTFPWLSRAVAGYDDRLAWLVDLAAHWQLAYATGLVIAGLVAAASRRRWLAALLLVPLPWLSAAPRLPAAPGSGAEFSIATANVHLDNQDPAALAAWLSKATPDLVVVTEVSPAFANALTRLADYPYRELAPADNPFGMAVLSRHPMQAATRRDGDGIARIEALIDVGGACIEVIAAHPMPPLSPHFHAARDALLREIAERSVHSSRPLLVVGDLNATPWSSAFSGLDDRGLRRAGELRPTWPAWGAGWFGIPIDHVLASERWRVRSAQIGPSIGSDHRPLLVRLASPEMATDACATGVASALPSADQE
jgi:endonuclease/exonuclease/phosphatase (EEP) superfamily protein YafD